MDEYDVNKNILKMFIRMHCSCLFISDMLMMLFSFFNSKKYVIKLEKGYPVLNL